MLGIEVIDGDVGFGPGGGLGLVVIDGDVGFGPSGLSGLGAELPFYYRPTPPKTPWLGVEGLGTAATIALAVLGVIGFAAGMRARALAKERAGK